MTQARCRRRTRTSTLFAVALVAACLAAALTTFQEAAGAHTPHDTASGVAVSPNFARDGTVYVIAASRLFVSHDGIYPWKPLVRGLPRAPEEGGSLARVAIAPTEPKRLFVSSRVGGVFRSDDGGASFRSASSGNGPQDVIPIAVSPQSPDVVLAAGAITGFFRTADGGATWTRVANISRVPAVTFVSATGRAVAGDGAGHLWVSDDDGLTWKQVSAGLGASMNAVAASTGSGPTVFAGDANGRVLRSEDGGSTFAPVGRGLPTDAVGGIALSPDYRTDHTLWASMDEHGVYRSTDSGATWVHASNGLTTDMQAHVVHVAEFRNIEAVRGAHGTTLFETAFDGFFRSDDGGRHWHELQTLVDFVVGLGVSPDYADDRSIAVATYVKGAYLSSDSGAHWRMIDRGLGQKPGEGNKFAEIRRLHSMMFSPDYAKDHTLFSAGWTAFLKSTDRGDNWSAIQVGSQTTTVELRQYVLGVAPEYPVRHELYLGTRQGDVYRSERSGDASSWTRIGNTGARVRTIVFDPDPASSTMFAGTASGVVHSGDRGATWNRTGPDGESMLAISPAFDQDGTLFAGTPNGLFVTRDRGSSWQPVRLPVTRGVEAVGVSPAFTTDGTVLVSLTGGPLLRSTDGGRSFREVGSALTESGHVIADFTNPTGTPIQFSPQYAEDRTIFAYGSQDVLRSTDRGETWEVLPLPSATTFRARLAASGVEIASQPQGSHSISKRRVAAIAGGIGVVLAILAGAVWWVRRRRRRGVEASRLS